MQLGSLAPWAGVGAGSGPVFHSSQAELSQARISGWLFGARDARSHVVERVGHEAGATAPRHIDDINRKAAAQKIMRPPFAPIRRGEKMHADQSAARHHDDRQGVLAVTQFFRNEIFDIGLADQRLLLVVRNDS